MKAKDIFQLAQGSIITVGFYAVLLLLIWDGNYKQEVALVVGALIGSYLTTVNWNFSSTKNSAEKTDMIYNSTKLPDQSTTQSTTTSTSETDIKPVTL